ncbi:XAC2610-related protein [Pseudoduganella chitinolytica]|uniref:VCBS repeat-containing protein n=1 Tax=Pseudoduganella chitinolytica TaxID=34070 RepID=A0ABY8BFY3_9BURK|nr:hypothetical protein [Pseudoduganella chitinolytica]WEF33876.1 hypothetical protein PX653_03610 [Pseudoduganella chitinolytica]
MKTLLRIGTLLACLGMGGPAHAEEAPPPAWHDQRVLTADFAFSALATVEDEEWFTIRGIRVVSRKTGQVVQELPIEGAEAIRRDADELVRIVDANFDGRPDIVITYMEAGAGPNYVDGFYLFDARQGRFVPDTDLSQLTQPAIHADGTITSSSRGGCCQFDMATYRYVNGKLVLVEASEEAMTADGKWIETRTRKLVKGKWQRRFKRVPNRPGAQ